MTVAQAAQKIGISTSKLYQLVAARRIAHYRIGGKIIFVEADVAAYFETCRVGVTVTSPVTAHLRPKLRHLNLG